MFEMPLNKQKHTGNLEKLERSNNEGKFSFRNNKNPLDARRILPAIHFNEILTRIIDIK